MDEAKIPIELLLGRGALMQNQWTPPVQLEFDPTEHVRGFFQKDWVRERLHRVVASPGRSHVPPTDLLEKISPVLKSPAPEILPSGAQTALHLQTSALDSFRRLRS